MDKNRRTALYLNIGAVITGVASWILLIILIAVRVAAVAAYQIIITLKQTIRFDDLTKYMFFSVL